MMPEKPDQKAANIVPFGLRMQPNLKQRIEAMARANNRSLNAEIVSRLEASLDAAETEPGKAGWVKTAKRAAASSPPNDRLDALEAEVRELRLGLLELRKARQGGQEGV